VSRPGVILDIDGTLVDTNYQHALAWWRAFRRNGIDVPLWRIHRSIGMGGDQMIPALLGDDVEAERGDDLRASEKEIYMGDLIEEVEPFSDARDFVAFLVDRGHDVVLSSSAKAEEVEHYLDLVGVRDVVTGWTTSADVEQTKPEPDVVRAGMEKLGGAADGAVMIGDSLYDVEAAGRTDVPTIGLLTGGFADAELREAGAVAVFESLSALREDIGETPLG
jgi:phosphoglycolate phosphatase-like HAD superfamily hydrolase